jgi:hypothetical protein
MRKLRYLLMALLALTALGILAFVVWAATPLGPMDEALAAIQPDNQVDVSTSSWMEFQPRQSQPQVGLILYPGGRVDHRSYAPIARQIAGQGYLVVIARMPLNLAIFNPNKAKDIIAAHPNIDAWAVGGHSLGGAMAAAFSSSNAELVEGLVLWAAYPPTSSDLSLLPLQVASIYGTRDNVLSLEQLEDTRALLPENTYWTVMEGGNHAQFGWYGNQPGDGSASISREEQQEQVLRATVKLLEGLQ